MHSSKLVIAAAALVSLAGCTTGNNDNTVHSTPNDTATPIPAGGSGGATSGGTTTGSTTNDGTTSGTPSSSGGSAGAPSVPTLINVNLQNVLNDLSVSLQVNRNSIPVTAQVPIDVAAAVCGVSVDALAASVASGHGSCNATTTTPQLNQVVQQQISTGGNVQGGDQTLNTGATGGT